MGNRPWEIYYRGCLGKWVDLFKSGDEKKIEDSTFRKYLELRKQLESLFKEINDLETKVSERYPLLKSIPTSSNSQENETYVNELIVYINSKK